MSDILYLYLCIDSLKIIVMMYPLMKWCQSIPWCSGVNQSPDEVISIPWWSGVNIFKNIYIIDLLLIYYLLKWINIIIIWMILVLKSIVYVVWKMSVLHYDALDARTALNWSKHKKFQLIVIILPKVMKAKNHFKQGNHIYISKNHHY